jgi:hypothetical protein
MSHRRDNLKSNIDGVGLHRRCLVRDSNYVPLYKVVACLKVLSRQVSGGTEKYLNQISAPLILEFLALISVRTLARLTVCSKFSSH